MCTMSSIFWRKHLIKSLIYAAGIMLEAYDAQNYAQAYQHYILDFFFTFCNLCNGLITFQPGLIMQLVANRFKGLEFIVIYDSEFRQITYLHTF